MEIPAALTNDVGPLPVWGWLAAGAVGIFLGRKVGGMFGGGSGSGAAAPGYSVPLAQYSAPPNAEADQGILSNHQWREQALSALISGGAGPLEADIALAGYLEGRQPTPEEAELLDIVLGQIGLPPEAPTIRPPEAPPAPAPTPTTDQRIDPYNTAAKRTVRDVYNAVLNRDPEADGLSYWEQKLATGEITHAQLTAELQASQEYKNLQASRGRS